jgi:copper chaperone NosL
MPWKTLLISTLFVISCNSGGLPDQAPTIRYGEDPCDECFMLINEARYAAAYTTTGGQSRRFDDIGCLLAYHSKHREDVANFWVAGFSTQKWVIADSALYFKSDSIQTPMGFGIIAFENERIARNSIPLMNQEPPLRFSQLLGKTEDPY